jgi:hypothetical protein
MARHSSKFRLVILSLVVLIMLASLIIVFYRLSSESKEASRLLNLIGQTEKEIALIDSARLFRDSAQEEIAAFESLVLSENKLVSVIESIEGAGRALSLETEIVSVSKVGDAPEGEPQEIEITIESNGSWTGNFSFLKAIENLPYQVKVREASFLKAPETWRSHISISLSTFN